MAHVAGFSIFNEQNYIQVDGAFQNIVLLQKIETTTYMADGRDKMSKAVVSAPSGTICVAHHCTQPASIWGVEDIGGGRRVTLWCEVRGAVPITVYCFGFPPPPSAKLGLQVFRADGSLAFSTEYDYMRVAMTYKAPDFRAIYGQVLSMEPGRKYAVCQMSPSSVFTIKNEEAHNIGSYFVYRDGNCLGIAFPVPHQARMGDIAYLSSQSGWGGTVAPPEGGVYQEAVSLMFVDVTDF